MTTAPDTAHVVEYAGPRQIRSREVQLPEIGPEDLLLEVEVCGVDGSDVHIYDGEIGWLNDRAPFILGDEIIGRIARIGAHAAKRRGLTVGDRVTVEARWPCGHCAVCASGQYFLCENNSERRGYGSINSSEPPHLWGGFATHAFVPPEALVHPIPGQLSLKAALFACSVLANGIRWSRMGGVESGMPVAVIGPGPQGLACVAASARAGADVVSIGLARDRERLETAAKVGASQVVAIAETGSVADVLQQVTEGVGRPHVVIETAGTAAAKTLAIELVKQTGVVVSCSVASPSVQPIDWMSLLRKELTLISPMSHPNTVESALQLAVEMLGEGIDVGDLVSHVYGLGEVERAIFVAAYRTEERPIKVVIDVAESLKHGRQETM